MHQRIWISLAVLLSLGSHALLAVPPQRQGVGTRPAPPPPRRPNNPVVPNGVRPSPPPVVVAPPITNPVPSGPAADARFRKVLQVGQYSIEFFDLTARDGSGGWVWWNNREWVPLDQWTPVGWTADHVRQLGAPGSTATNPPIQPVQPVQPPATVATGPGSYPPGSFGPNTSLDGLLGMGNPSGAPGSQSPNGYPNPGAQTNPGTAPGGASPGTATATGSRPFPNIPYANDILYPRDPAWERAVAAGRIPDYVAIRTQLASQFPAGGPLQANDPWRKTIRIGGRDYDFYDRSGKYGNQDGWVWWKPGVGWVELATEAPPGFDPRLLDAYRSGTAGIIPPASPGSPTNPTNPGYPNPGQPTQPTQPPTLDPQFAQAHGGVTQTLPPILGSSTTYPIPPVGSSQGERLIQNLRGGGVVLGDGTRVLFDGYDEYRNAAGQTYGVRYQRMVYDPRSGRWAFYGLTGVTADGRRWRADQAWYEPVAGGALRARFTTGGRDGVLFENGTLQPAPTYPVGKA